MSQHYPKILKAEYFKDLILTITFSDNSVKYYNFEKIISKPAFRKLSKIAYLKNFEIAEGGFGLIWDDETDIAESELWLNGVDYLQSELSIVE